MTGNAIRRTTFVAIALLCAAWYGLPTSHVRAADQASLYSIEKEQVDKDGRPQDRILLARRPAPDGRSTLYVTVQFKVAQADGQPALDVSGDEIVVKENGRPVTDLEVHTPAASEPLTTVLAIDMSGSMKEHGKMEEAKHAAGLFLDKLHEQAQCGLILFDHMLRQKHPPGTDRNRIRQFINETQPGGGTAYLDATAEALNMLRGVKGRKAVVLLTDGVDLNSRRSMTDVIEQARAENVQIYTVGVGEPGSNLPVSTVMVLDCSGSMDDPAENGDELSKMQALHQAAGRFVDIMRPGARTTLLPFSDEVAKPEPFSADKHVLKRGIQQLEAGGETRLFDAIYDAVETLVAEHPEGKRAVVALTDGMDNRSRRRVREVIDAARKAEVPLHMMGFGRPGELDERIMRRLAQETGGTYHYARNRQKLFDIFENLSIQLHDDGVDETALRKLADTSGGKYFSARDISQLRFIYEGLAQELQTTYTVTFPSLQQDNDGTSRDIDISIWRKGTQVSDVLRSAYNVGGVVVPEMDSAVYLLLLVGLVGLLAVPAGLRHFARKSAAG
jgi:VWFA-related protein